MIKMLIKHNHTTYDTTTSRILAHYDNFLLPSDPKYIYYAAMKEERRYFIFVSGNPGSDEPGQKVIPMTKKEIEEWIEEHKDEIER